MQCNQFCEDQRGFILLQDGLKTGKIWE